MQTKFDIFIRDLKKYNFQDNGMQISYLYCMQWRIQGGIGGPDPSTILKYDPQEI